MQHGSLHTAALLSPTVCFVTFTSTQAFVSAICHKVSPFFKEALFLISFHCRSCHASVSPPNKAVAGKALRLRSPRTSFSTPPAAEIVQLPYLLTDPSLLDHIETVQATMPRVQFEHESREEISEDAEASNTDLRGSRVTDFSPEVHTLAEQENVRLHHSSQWMKLGV